METLATTPSRRNFLKGAGAVLAGAAALGVVGCSPNTGTSGESTDASNISWDEEYDVVIVGAGIAGLTAAITVADEGNGASCLLIEKDAKPNGNSPFCAGWQLYVEDVEGAKQYINKLMDGCTPEPVIDAFVNGLHENLEWLLNLGAQKEWLDIYEPTDPNAINEYAEYPGDDLMGFLLFKTDGDIPYYHLFDFLMSVVEERGDAITYKTSTPMESLVKDSSGAIVGVVANGKNYRAKRGVIMCCGGFESDPDMLRDYTGVAGYPFAGIANTGDGHRACMKIGADFWHMHSGAQYWMSVRDVENTRFLSTLFSFTSKQYGITVGVSGRRFYQDFDACSNYANYTEPDSNPALNVGYRHGITQFGGHFAHLPMPEKAWFIYDADGLAAGAIPAETSTDPVADGWAYKADTIEELAAAIEVPAEELTKTVAQWNEFCDRGEDLSFYRPEDTLTPIAKAPFYASLCVPAMLNTDGGPVRGVGGEILDPDGNPIPGLYSAGEFGSVWGNLYEGAGNVGECGAFGRISARSALSRTAE